jgi:hypothetical protein
MALIKQFIAQPQVGSRPYPLHHMIPTRDLHRGGPGVRGPRDRRLGIQYRNTIFLCQIFSVHSIGELTNAHATARRPDVGRRSRTVTWNKSPIHTKQGEQAKHKAKAAASSNT